MFTLEKKSNIAYVAMNDTSQAQNVLNTKVMAQMEPILSELEQDTSLQGLVFYSTKPNCFIAGADITMLQSFTSPEVASDSVQSMHDFLQRLINLPMVTVAAIDGVCLGGGYEFTLGFDYRVASTNEKTKIGLPEVQLGLLPGGGGTQRVPRMMGVMTALDMMLTGKQSKANKAKRLGLVDATVPAAYLLLSAEKYIAKGKPVRKPSLKFQLLNSSLARKVIFSQARKKTLKATKGHYPAPLKIIDVIEQGLSDSLQQGLELEKQGFVSLLMTDESKQLINLFFAHTELKKETGVQGEVSYPEVQTVGVLGAGLMGAGIANVSINQAKKRVRLKDVGLEGLAKGVAHIGQYFDAGVKRKKIGLNQRNQIMSRLTSTLDYSGLSNANIVIEAVFEDLDLKQKMVADIEHISSEENPIIFATNTSALPIKEIAQKAQYPERIIGMHYFSPVEKMPLLEIITSDKTADWVTASAVALGKQQGKTVIVVKDGPGFYTTRILAPYNMEAIRLILEGVSIERIDGAMKKMGFPIGPIKLLDEVGIDVGMHIAENLAQAFADRISKIDGIEQFIQDKRLGKKTKRGFYDYSDKSKGKQVDEAVYALLSTQPNNNSLSDDDVTERMLYAMLNEAAYCLGEGILHNARDGDIGAIFGLGFPPFLGGPFRYMDNTGLEQTVEKLDRLQEKYGVRFAPAPILLEMSENKKAFYGD